MKYILNDTMLKLPLIFEAEDDQMALETVRRYYASEIDPWYAAQNLYDAAFSDIENLTEIDDEQIPHTY